MKYGRITESAGAGDQSVADLFTTDPSDETTPMKVPTGVADPLLWLNKMFEHQAAAWVASAQHFRPLPGSVLPSSIFTGDRTDDAEVADGGNYQNPDGTNGV